LEESEEKYRTIVEGQTELISRFLPDTALSFVNEAYCRYFRTTPERVLGQTALRIFPNVNVSKPGSALRRCGPINAQRASNMR
jgi:PAS domain S-box-containing protein